MDRKDLQELSRIRLKDRIPIHSGVVLQLQVLLELNAVSVVVVKRARLGDRGECARCRNGDLNIKTHVPVANVTSHQMFL